MSAPAAGHGTAPVVSHRRAVLALTALSLATFCFVTTEVLPTGLLTLIAKDLDRQPSQIGLIVTGYALVVAVTSLPLTRLTANVPRRLLLTSVFGVFVAATTVSAFASTFEVLLAARLVNGLTQAVFWSVVASTATGLFPPEIRGRMVSRLAIGNALAPVVGVPVGTFIAQQTNWRMAFVVISALSLVTCIAIAALVPTVAPKEGGAARGTAPDGRRLAVVLLATVLGVAGPMAVFTYITPFLLDVPRFAPSSLALLLSVSGASGVVGTLLVGRFLDRRPRAALVVLLGILTLATSTLGHLGEAPAAAVVGLAFTGLSFSALVAAIQHRVLQVAPGSTDIASAAMSSVFNVGTAAGAWVGGLLLADLGAAAVPQAAGMLCGVALVLMVLEPVLVRRPPAPAAAGSPVGAPAPDLVDVGPPSGVLAGQQEGNS